MRQVPFTLLLGVLILNGMIAGYALDQHLDARAAINPNPRIAPGLSQIDPSHLYLSEAPVLG